MEIIWNYCQYQVISGVFC